MKQIKEYVAGFLFSRDGSLLALILKNKPDWQKGKLNAIGGKIEDGETPLHVFYNTEEQLRIGALRLIHEKGNPDTPYGWDKKIWQHMTNKPLKERLIIAGALIAAEIDRINYNETKNQ